MAGHHALLNCAGEIDRLGSDGRGFGLNFYSLLHRQLHRDRDVAHAGDRDRDFGFRRSKARCGDGDAIVAGREIIEPKLAPVFADGLAAHTGTCLLRDDCGGRDAGSSGVLHRAP